eukprot:CAMPEP_0116931194 /NCGR_PEP_ID=MMETSP0467-20121206/27666_1 /TAXON_ID=283647 /ORGANISM="Mesodinium pulex, Strain SPMC105" /LENGTH=75 /DNA_ID=CAMNT_0004611577 /DNA_START=645 /DNA_END=872 /DNA_ORIENTATION=-
MFLAVFVDGLCSAEVDDFGVELGVDDDVLGLEVVVGLADFVEVRLGDEDLRHKHAHGGLAEAMLGGEDDVEQFSA